MGTQKTVQATFADEGHSHDALQSVCVSYHEIFHALLDRQWCLSSSEKAHDRAGLLLFGFMPTTGAGCAGPISCYPAQLTDAVLGQVRDQEAIVIGHERSVGHDLVQVAEAYLLLLVLGLGLDLLHEVMKCDNALQHLRWPIVLGKHELW